MASFFDRIFGGGRVYTQKQTPALACELTIGGSKYLLEEFDIDVDIDDNKRYVPLYAVFADKLEPELDVWITNESKRMDGMIKFYKNEGKLEEGAVFTIKFDGASCIRYQKTTNADIPLTTLVLAAKAVKILDQEL